jgi:hypothetical protein
MILRGLAIDQHLLGIQQAAGIEPAFRKIIPTGCSNHFICDMFRNYNPLQKTASFQGQQHEQLIN